MIASQLRTIRPTIHICKDTQNPRHLQAPAKTFFLPAKNAYPDGKLFLIQRRIKRIERIFLARDNYKRITRIFAAAGQLRANYSKLHVSKLLRQQKFTRFTRFLPAGQGVLIYRVLKKIFVINPDFPPFEAIRNSLPLSNNRASPLTHLLPFALPSP